VSRRFAFIYALVLSSLTAAAPREARAQGETTVTILRRTAVQLPATYADVATDFLTRYTDDTNWRGTWVANHIFYHESRQYGRHR